jgi:sugar lactone lactonase YvrE
MGLDIDIAADAHAFTGESPVWDHRDNVLWWVDQFHHAVHVYDHATGVDKIAADVGAELGSVALRERGGLVVCMPEGLVALDPSTGEKSLLSIVDHDSTQWRLNDCGVDQNGHLFAGSMAHNSAEPGNTPPEILSYTPGLLGQAKLFRFDPGVDPVVVLEGVIVSNGMGWSPDGERFYYIDTLTLRLDVFDYDLGSGAISNRRPFVSLAPAEGLPDGMTVDEEGGVWLVLMGTGQIRRYTPAGTLDQTIQLELPPFARVTNCTFGGPNLDEMFITTHTARMTDTERRNKANAHAGALLHCVPGVRGLRANAFGG